MCTNLHYVYNKYIHERVLVPCGKCDSCRQQKADARANRIKLSCPAGCVQLFVTLTYDNNHLPIVFKDDLKEFSFVPIYRYNKGNLKKIGEQYLSELPYDFKSELTPTPRHLGDNRFLGVCFYKDIQDFMKRLRITLQRKYNYAREFKYYACTEYGETYYRPHSHLVFTVCSSDVELFRALIASCWSFADYNRTYTNIEIARHCADYVASYVNCDTSIPKILQTPAFRQKHAYSLGYGASFSTFSCVEIVKKAHYGDMSFGRANSLPRNGVDSFLIPRYIVNRFFPQFKGYSQLTLSEIRSVLLRPSSLAEIFNGRYSQAEYDVQNFVTDSDIRALCVRLTHAYERYAVAFADCGKKRSYYDYVDDYILCWQTLFTTKMRYFYEAMNNDVYHELADYYDNLVDVKFGLVKCDYVDKLCKNLDDYTNYNSLSSRLVASANLAERYRRKVKQKKVTNSVLQLLHSDI